MKKLSSLKRILGNRLALGWYYGISSKVFRREHRAVLAGRIAHLGEGGTLDAQRYTLRRNVHRLEKGLIMRPLKNVFALDYLEETITAFERVAPADATDPERRGETAWFADVLRRYFASVAQDARVAAWAERFTRAAGGVPAGDSSPYAAEKRPECRVGYDEFHALCRRRRSVRWFLDRPVPEALLDRALDAARQAPSACNRQPFRFLIANGKPLTQEIASIPMGTRGFAEGFPAIVVLVGDLSAYFDERDRHVIYIDGSLAVMQFMLALETLGLASCPINWPDIEDREKRMDQVLGLAAHERPILLIAVGYADPAGGVPYSEKTPLSHLRRYL